MKISKIASQKTNKGRCNIYLDGEFAFGVDKEFVFSENLKEGKNLTEEEISRIVEKDLEKKLFDKACHFLSYRPRSRQEIRNNLWKKVRKLKKETVEQVNKEALIERVLDKLSDLGYVDDSEFASWWVKQRIQFKPRGKYLLKSELFKKGVDRQTIKTELVKYTQDDELAWARSLLEKKRSRYKALSKNEQREKLSKLLVRRGFSWDIVNQVLEKFFEDYS
ncbi:MAG: RecX family transcriptional regulator [Patescibacteria group bacterium]